VTTAEAQAEVVAPVDAAAAAEPEHHAGLIRRLVVGGLLWKAVSQIVGQFGRSIVAIVLARLLEPRDFGLANMVLVFASLVLVFSDLALGAAIVQRKKLTDLDRATAFWTSIAAGTLFMLILMAASPLIAAFYGEHQVQPLLMVLSTTFLISSIATTHEALLVREMAFKAVETRTMIGVLCGAVAGVAVGVGGGGAWAIIAQQVATALVTTILLVQRSPWRAGFAYSRASLRDMGGFSGFVLGHRLLYYVHRNADNLLIGRYVGAAALGAYALAYNVILLPFSRLATPVQQVLFPAFSRMQDQPEKIAALWIRSTRLVGALSIPALCGLVVVAPDVVPVVFGARWHQAVTLIQVLAWVGLLQSLQTLNTEILTARDKTSTIFRFSVGFFGAHITAFIVGLHWGVEGVAIAYAISSTIVEPVFTWMTARSLQISMWKVVWSFGGVAQASIVMGLACYGLRHVLVGAGVGDLGRLVLVALAGIALYLPLVWWRQPELRSEVGVIRGMLARRRTADATA
jgi:O-antigen/teichoic acid export membrane protein